jgi:hypothetical protein
MLLRTQPFIHQTLDEPGWRRVTRCGATPNPIKEYRVEPDRQGMT